MNEIKYTLPHSWKGNITRFLTAQTLSLFGSALVQYAIVWHITLTTSSGVMMTLSTLCGFLPQIAISLFAGVWADRYSRKTLIMLADGAIALSTLALALFFLGGNKSIWLLFGVLIIRSAGSGIQTPAVNALVPQLVPEEKLMRIGGINSTIQSLMNLLAPAASGALLSLLGLEATFFVDVVTALMGISITATVTLPPLAATTEKRPAVLTEAMEGLRYLWGKPLVRGLLLFQLSILFLISPSAFLTPLLVSRTFGAEVWYLTASEMTYSAGAVAGGILISAWGGFQNRMTTTVTAGLLYGALMITIGLSPAFLLYLLCNFLIGITAPCYNAPITVMLQERVEPRYHGRVFSFLQITSSCALPLGMLCFGPMADRVSVQSLLLTCGSLVILVTLFTLLCSRTGWGSGSERKNV